jgi:hypothetical protein
MRLNVELSASPMTWRVLRRLSARALIADDAFRFSNPFLTISGRVRSVTATDATLFYSLIEIVPEVVSLLIAAFRCSAVRLCRSVRDAGQLSKP